VRRSYSDPIKARLSTVEDLKPTQWAGIVRTVALQAQRHDWSMERVTETFDMLGLDAKAARDAKASLRRSIRLKWVDASTPHPKALPMPRVHKPAPRKPAVVSAKATLSAATGLTATARVTELLATHWSRDRQGRFAPGSFCVRGLHRMTDTNRLTRRDRSSVQCRACTVARGKAKPV
jgi:hypothetical protein